MAEADTDTPACRGEIARLNKIIQALMNRAERSTNIQSSDFSLFASTIILEAQVRSRTKALETALGENEKTNRSLRESESKFRAVVNQSLIGIAILEDGKFSYTNSKFEEIFGYGGDEMRELGPLNLAAPSDVPFIEQLMRRRLDGEVAAVDYTLCGRRKDGGFVTVEIQTRVIESRAKLTLLTMAIDVTQRNRVEREVRSLEQRLREESTHDALTGLYNRRYLDEHLSRELKLAQRRGVRVSAVMGDLDHFKAINDCYGHPAGDQVLREFGGLLKRRSRETDLLFRYGGEEFLLILPGMTEEAAVKRAEQLRRAIAKTPVRVGATVIAVTASFGVAEFPRHGKSGDELIAAADKALYGAKFAGRNQVKSFSSFGDKLNAGTCRAV